MTGPLLASLRRTAVAQLRSALWRAAGVLMLTAAATAAVGLAVAAGILATADRIGVVEALLTWSAGLLVVVLAAILVAMLVRRLRQPAAPAATSSAAPVPDGAASSGAPAATLLNDIGFQAGLGAGRSLSPLGMVATAFIVGALIARSGQR